MCTGCGSSPRHPMLPTDSVLGSGASIGRNIATKMSDSPAWSLLTHDSPQIRSIGHAESQSSPVPTHIFPWPLAWGSCRRGRHIACLLPIVCGPLKPILLYPHRSQVQFTADASISHRHVLQVLRVCRAKHQEIISVSIDSTVTGQFVMPGAGAQSLTAMMLIPG